MSRNFFNSTSNPALSKDKLNDLIYSKSERTSADVMTLGGTINKTAILLGLITIAAGYTFYLAGTGSAMTMPLTWGGMGVGFVLALVIMFKPQHAAKLAPVYAVAEGLFLGGISAMYAAKTGGIIVQAVGLTLATLFTMLAVYRFRIIKVTEKFKSVMITLIGAIMVYYVAAFVLSFFGIHISHVHQGGLMGIGICIVILVVAALTLLLDFDFIEKSIQYGAPKNTEWYAGFALVLTIVWLYIEFLRLLSLLSSD